MIFSDLKKMNFDLIKKSISEYDIKAVLIVHLYGFVHPLLDEIKEDLINNNILKV